MRSRTTTAPTCLRSQVDRVATCRAMRMKYSSQLARRSVMTVPFPCCLPAGVYPERLNGCDPKRLDPAPGPWLVPAVRRLAAAACAVCLLAPSGHGIAAPKSPRAEADTLLGR